MIINDAFKSCASVSSSCLPLPVLSLLPVVLVFENARFVPNDCCCLEASFTCPSFLTAHDLRHSLKPNHTGEDWFSSPRLLCILPVGFPRKASQSFLLGSTVSYLSFCHRISYDLIESWIALWDCTYWRIQKIVEMLGAKDLFRCTRRRRIGSARRARSVRANVSFFWQNVPFFRILWMVPIYALNAVSNFFSFFPKTLVKFVPELNLIDFLIWSSYLCFTGHISP